MQAPIVKPLVRALIFKSSIWLAPWMTHSYVKESSIIRHDLWVIYLTHNFYWPRWLYNVTECCNNKSAKNSILKFLYYVMQLCHNNYVIHHAGVANHVILAYSSVYVSIHVLNHSADMCNQSVASCNSHLCMYQNQAFDLYQSWFMILKL